tara:strand:+ start:592 stop:1017 length:426 start_codon:yes stop_codon:yes gene_type:complete
MAYRSDGVLLFDFSNPSVKKALAYGLNEYFKNLKIDNEHIMMITLDENPNYVGFRFSQFPWYESKLLHGKYEMSTVPSHGKEITYLNSVMDWLDSQETDQPYPEPYIFIRVGEEADDLERRGAYYLINLLEVSEDITLKYK